MKTLQKCMPISSFWRGFVFYLFLFYICGGNLLKGQTYDKVPDEIQTAPFSDSPLQIFDDFGNTYTLEQVSVPKQMPPQATCDFDANGTTAGFSFTVDFFENEPNLGFDNPNYGTDAQSVVCQVLTDLSHMLHGSLDCSGNKPHLRIQVQPSFEQYSISGYPLGQATAYSYNYSNQQSSLPSFVHNSVWRTINGGEDPTSYPYINGYDVYHGYMKFNFHPNVAWNFDMNINHTNTFVSPDFYQVVLHEVTHMLGISSLINEDGTSKFTPTTGAYNPAGTGMYNRFDKYLIDQDTNLPLLVNQNNCYDISFATTNDVTTGGCDRIHFTSDNVDLSIYSPAGEWVDVSSLSHFGNVTDNCDDTHYLMHHKILNDEFGNAIRRPTNPEIEALCAIGYQNTGTYGDGNFVFHSGPSDAPVPICGSIAAGVDDDGPNCDEEYHFSACDITENPFVISISEILANDINVSPILEGNCITPIVGNIALNVSGDDINITNASIGFNVIRYLPTHAITGEDLNPTFVYFYVAPCMDNCEIMEDCNLVCNPNMINICDDTVFSGSYPPTGGAISSNDLANCINFDGWVPCNSTPNFWSSSSFPSIDEGALGLLVSGPNILIGDEHEESIATSTFIEENKKYILSFYRMNSDEVTDIYNGILEELNVNLANDYNCNTSSSSVYPWTLGQSIYQENDIPNDNNWSQAINCFVADDDYSQLIIYAKNESDDVSAYYLIDNVSIMEDTFIEEETTYLDIECCTSANLVSDVCSIIPNVEYTWEQFSFLTSTWEIIENATDPFYETPEICDDCVLYRVTRSINTENPIGDFPITGNFECLMDIAYFEVCSECGEPENPFECDVEYHITPDMSSHPNIDTNYDDGRPAYIVTPNTTQTWLSNSNEFTNTSLYGGGDIYIDVDIVIPRNTTVRLQSLNMYFAPNRRFLIEEGGRLIFDGDTTLPIPPTIGGTCDIAWQGIQVEGPGQNNIRTGISPNAFNYGVLEIVKPVIIQDAIVGIAAMKLPLMDVDDLQLAVVDNFILSDNLNVSSLSSVYLANYVGSNFARNNAGGVVHLRDVNIATHFENCLQGVNLSWFKNYPNAQIETGVSHSHIGDGVFNTDNLPIPFNTVSQPNILRSEVGVALNDYSSILVENCIFNDHKYGVRAIEAVSVGIRGNYFNNDKIGVSVFNGFGQSLSDNVNIANNAFEACEVGIQGSTVSGLRVLNNEINLNTPLEPLPQRTDIGIFVRGSSFEVTENAVENLILGTVIMDNITPGSMIHGNIYTNALIGVWAFDDNSGQGEGVQITCNDFNAYATAICVQDFIHPTLPFLNAAGRLDNQGDCVTGGANLPADNTFNPMQTLIPDVISMVTDEFTYFHRNQTGAFVPTLGGNANGVQTVSSQECSSPPQVAVNCEGMNGVLNDDDIKLLLTAAYIDKEAIKKMRYYTSEEVNDRDAAVALLEDISSTETKRFLITHYIETGDFSKAESDLNTLSQNTEEEQNFYILYKIYKDIKASGRQIWQMTATEEATVRNIAESHTATAYDAQAILLLAYGEEFPIALPALPEFVNEVLQSDLNIVFKHGNNDIQVQEKCTVYPNPVKHTAQISHHLEVNETATFDLYDMQGKKVGSKILSGSGTTNLNTQNLTSGIYFYQLTKDANVIAHDKLIIVK